MGRLPDIQVKVAKLIWLKKQESARRCRTFGIFSLKASCTAFDSLGSCRPLMVYVIRSESLMKLSKRPSSSKCLAFFGG